MADDDLTPRLLSIAALAVAVVTMLLSAGQCGVNERETGENREKIEHLERRLDDHLGNHG